MERLQGKTPSNYSWPGQLASLLSIDVVNNGDPGTSNKEICHRIVNYEFNPKDLVVIGWTFPERESVFKDKDNSRRYSHVWRDKGSKFYVRFMLETYDRYFQTMTHINLVSSYLKHNNIKNIGFICCHDGGYNEWVDSNYGSTEWVTRIHDIEYYKILDTYGTVCDKFHPSKKSHEQIALRLKNILYA